MATAWRENATGGKVAFELPVSQLTTDGIKSLASPMSSSLFAATQAGWFRSRLEHIMIPGAINRILILGYRDCFRRVNVMSRSVQSIPKLFQKFQRSKFSVVRLPAELEVIQTTQVNLPYQAIDLYLLGSAGPADLFRRRFCHFSGVGKDSDTRFTSSWAAKYLAQELTGSYGLSYSACFYLW